MSKLTPQEVARYALAHRMIYEYGCDEVDCGKLIPAGSLFVVVKWRKREDGLTFLGRHPAKVRCMECQLLRHPIKAEVKVAGAGRGAKKVSQEEASKLNINPVVRRVVLGILKKLAPKEKLLAVTLLAQLRKRKAVRELKRTEITSTLRGIKKLKLIKYSQKSWFVPPPKKQKKLKSVKKEQIIVPKRKKKLAKR